MGGRCLSSKTGKAFLCACSPSPRPSPPGRGRNGCSVLRNQGAGLVGWVAANVVYMMAGVGGEGEGLEGVGAARLKVKGLRLKAGDDGVSGVSRLGGDRWLGEPRPGELLLAAVAGQMPMGLNFLSKFILCSTRRIWTSSGRATFRTSKSYSVSEVLRRTRLAAS